MKYSVDRFEGDKALLISEGGVRRIVAASLLPAGTREGGIVVETGGVFTADAATENAVKRRIFRLQERLKGAKGAGKKNR